MRAFEVYLNGRKLCLAGIGNRGVLDAHVIFVSRGGSEELALKVGGLVSTELDHVIWRSLGIRVGDEVRVRIVEATSVDKPAKRRRMDPAADIKAKKRYVRQMAKELGWKIIPKPR